MIILNGVSGSSGIAMGRALIRHKEKISVTSKYITKNSIDNEIKRLEDAVDKEITEIDSIIDKYTQDKQEKKLLNSHKMILQDPELYDKVINLIKHGQYTAEYSLQQYLRKVSESFAKMKNDYFAERVYDFEDAVLRLINRLNGNKNLIDDVFITANDKAVILVLEDISPTDVAKSYHSNVNGICLSRGSKTSHTTIIARALGLPVVVGVSELFEKVSEDDQLIIDSNQARVIINPDKETYAKYKEQLVREEEEKNGLSKIVHEPVRTADGKKLQLLCNIELEEEIDTVLQNNADGIGLFRTEYIFIEKQHLPTEDEQYDIYHKLALRMKGRQLIIRTYDLGGDKLADSIELQTEKNPFLGCRGIRLSLRYPEIFKTQIKALIRANEIGNISVMFPMVASGSDVVQALKIVDQCKKELLKDNLPHNPNIKIGAMIEIPSAVFCIAELAHYCDFFSIGTNDLVQYTLAADRDNKNVEKYYDPYNPAVIKLIALTLINAHRFGKPVSICGEVAVEKDYLPLLIGLDIDSISVNPALLLNVKRNISECNYKESKQLVKKLIKANTKEQVMDILKG